MDLDIEQVFMYILHRPLFSVVDHISSLYQIAARTTDTRVKEVLIAVAKEFMNIMLLFDVEHQLDFRNIKPQRYFKIISFAQIASKSSALRLSCAYGAACSSAAAWVITKLVDKINDEETKNVLRHHIEEFNRISMEFQSVSEMIFRDRPINPEIIRPLILQHIRPWIPYVPPFPVPRVGDELVFSGLLTEPMLYQIRKSTLYLKCAVGALGVPYRLFMEDGVALDRVFNVLTYMVIAQSFLEHHFPRNIEPSRRQDEDRLVWDRRRLEVHWMLSQVSDIIIMAMVEIESLSSLSNFELVYGSLHYSANRLNHAYTAVETDLDSDYD